MRYWRRGRYVSTSQIAEGVARGIAEYERRQENQRQEVYQSIRDYQEREKAGPWAIVLIHKGVITKKKYRFRDPDSLVKKIHLTLIQDSSAIYATELKDPSELTENQLARYNAVKQRHYIIEYNPHRDRRWFKPKTEQILESFEKKLDVGLSDPLLARYFKLNGEIGILVSEVEDPDEKVIPQIGLLALLD